MKPACRQMKETFRRNEAVCNRIIGLIQLISNKTRFRIICLLYHGEFCVSEIVQVVSEGRLANISQQLKMLAVAGVIERRRDGRQILYSLKDDRVRSLIQYFRKHFLNEA